MKKIFIAVLSFFMLLSNVSNAAIDEIKATDFVKKVVKEGIEEIIDSNVSQKEKVDRFRTLFNKDLDLDFIGKFVLGRYWRTSTPEQRDAFIAAYRELNVKTWSGRFDDFTGKDFVFHGTTPSNNADQLFVNSSVDMGQGQQPAKVIWRVKQNDDSFKVVDIIIENVSLAITARNEYAAFIKKAPGGVDDLIKNLQAKTKDN
ncbi:MAG: ABC transporter substrate-binding protein [Lactobacillaceae bacterium]|jgi:phospholipid transport system substrate-binding protein|nr:ABC transporter substrate-binding protein [Lactobacillaceae bacterium]